MEAVRRAITQMNRQFAKLTQTQRLLVACVGVIAVMTLFLVSQYAGGTKFVDIASTDDAADTVEYLQSKGVNARIVRGAAHVPSDQRRVALVKLAEGGRLPNDTTLMFSNLSENLKWTDSREQNEQKFIIALQNELSKIISAFDAIESARVILDIPQPRGIGVIVREPTASVTVFTMGGRPLKRDTVDAIASLVARARAGLTVTNVSVIDGSNGISHSASDDESMRASNYLELATAAEKKKAATIQAMLSYIPGVTVAVTAEVNNTRENVRMKTYRTPDDGGTVVGLATKDMVKTERNSTTATSAEPGFRSNATADINSGGGGGITSEKTEASTDLSNFVGEEVTERMDPKGMPTRFAASINVPRSFIALAITRGAADAAEPDDDVISARFELERSQIERSVLPHLQAGEVEGVVRVNLVPDTGLIAGANIQRAGYGGSGGISGALGLPDGAVNTMLVGGAALMALCMMVFMVRRAGKEPPMPSVEELVGIPPPLESTRDLVGEAGESDLAMEGIEVAPEDVERQQMLDQLTQLVGDDPDSTAKLLNRWISVED